MSASNEASIITAVPGIAPSSHGAPGPVSSQAGLASIRMGARS